MRTIIAGIALATVAVALGGCAGGNLGGSSLLPTANQNRQIVRHLGPHAGDVLGGPTPGAKRWHIRSNDVLGGPTVTPPQ
jgi:hypothetical protein